MDINDIKNIFRGRKNRKDVEEATSNVEQDDQIAQEEIDVPKVVFEDLELQVTVGQWLGLLSSQQGFGTEVFAIYTHLSAEELMQRMDIPTEKLNEINTKFGLLLKSAGIDTDEICTIDQYDKKDFSFNCHFNNADRDSRISLRWGDMIDFGPEFTIAVPNVTKTYDYCREYKDKPARLNLQHYTISNPENGNSCFKFLSPYNTNFRLENGDYTFSMEISRPESIEHDVFSDYVFSLKNEEQLEQYLLGLSFPLNIDEVYKKICEISIDSVSEYPKFNIKVEKKVDEKKSKTTDMVSLSHGKLRRFIITKNGRTIEIDGDGNWSYDSPKLAISQSEENGINYSLNSIPTAEIASMASPLEEYTKVSKEVDDIKVFTKKMLKPNEE